ncbi:MAG TPA: imidazole glycerol phosphate synthase subunit HisH [Kiloniellaceae bacterium]
MSATARTIGIVDYGMGNLHSVCNALAEIGAPAELFSDPQRAADYDKIIIPGVGAFQEAMENLRSLNMVAALDRHVDEGKLLLGICLGMQLICRKSHEDGEHEGLGWIDAEVLHFPPAEAIKVPHMGWNAIDFERPHPLLQEVRPGADVYFVHSYYVDCAEREASLATTEHGIRFTSVVARGNIFGMQFHPEKSQHVGMQLLRNFVDL